MVFDESIRIPPLWIDNETLQFLNHNREEIKKKHNTSKVSNKTTKKVYSAYKVVKEDSDDNYGFCHQCKQRKSSIILAKCSYTSGVMGHAVPSSIIVKGIKAFNVEPYNTQAINYCIKTQLPDSRRRKDENTTNNENYEYHECNRMF
jgi:hypothetical protein